MGVNTIASLPNGVTVYQVERALERVTGRRVEVTPTTILGMLDISLRDGTIEHHATYHYEGGHDAKTRTLHCGSSSTFWAAVAVKLVDCFGGTVDVNDCDRSDVDFARKRSWPTFGPDATVDDINAWDERLKARIEALTPITTEDRARWLAVVAHKDLTLARRKRGGNAA
jgi:hypothetical protein